MRKTARPVVWEGDGAQSPSLDPIRTGGRMKIAAVVLAGYAGQGGLRARRRPRACPSVPSMGRISLDERSQPEPMTATVAKRKG